MNKFMKIGQGMAVLAMIWAASGCVVAAPREGYYDQPHHRYYHERAWHECGPDEHYCR
jgi:hypothetical protein